MAVPPPTCAATVDQPFTQSKCTTQREGAAAPTLLGHSVKPKQARISGCFESACSIPGHLHSCGNSCCRSCGCRACMSADAPAQQNPMHKPGGIMPQPHHQAAGNSGSGLHLNMRRLQLLCRALPSSTGLKHALQQQEAPTRHLAGLRAKRMR